MTFKSLIFKILAISSGVIPSWDSRRIRKTLSLRDRNSGSIFDHTGGPMVTWIRFHIEISLLLIVRALFRMTRFVSPTLTLQM